MAEECGIRFNADRGDVLPPKPAKSFTCTATTTFVVEPVTSYRVVRHIDRDAPRSSYSDLSGTTICVCQSEAEAQRIARLLADGMVQ